MTPLEELATRALFDSATDREAWLAGHDRRIGGSDAEMLAKPESVERYVAAKLRPRKPWSSAAVRAGNAWEPLTLDWIGATHNTVCYRSRESERFVATPDGVDVDPDDPDALLLTEIKTFTGKIVDGPTPAYRREMAWQQMVVGPAVRRTRFVWRELVGGVPRELEPKVMIYERDEKLIARLRGMALQVLARLDDIPVLN